MVLLAPLALALRMLSATWRFEVDRVSERIIRDVSSPVVIFFWHNRLIISPEIYRRYRRGRRVCGLVSASRDGAWLAAFLRLVEIDAARGSSSRRSLSATRELLRAIERGADVAITPDGPRGPCYAFHPGAVMVALKAAVPVVYGSARFDRAWRLESWDGFYIPKPFARIRLEVERIDDVSVVADGDRDDTARHMSQRLQALTSDEPLRRPAVPKQC